MVLGIAGAKCMLGMFSTTLAMPQLFCFYFAFHIWSHCLFLDWHKTRDLPASTSESGDYRHMSLYPSEWTLFKAQNRYTSEQKTDVNTLVVIQAVDSIDHLSNQSGIHAGPLHYQHF
jgi:hypothetical protein